MKMLNKKKRKGKKTTETHQKNKIVKSNVVEFSKESNEGYKNKKVLELGEIKDFSGLSDLEPPDSSLTLWDRKDLAVKYFNEKKYRIEDILDYDNTNPDIQEEYLTQLVNKLNQFENTTEDKNIIEEKIQKSGIILSKKIYEEKIKNIKDETIRKKLGYIDYKYSLVDTLKYMKDNKNSDALQAKEKLQIKKIFYFNHESILGENNYHFYGLAIELSKKLIEIYKHYKAYIYIIEKYLNYLYKNFNNLNKNEIYIFKYLSNILVDNRSIKNREIYEEIVNYLEGESLSNIEDLKNAIKDRNNKESSKEESNFKNNVNYFINFNNKNNLIEYIIKEEQEFDARLYLKNRIKLYNYKNFNKHIIDVIKKVDLDHFEDEIFKKILPKNDLNFYFFENIKPIIFDILKKILSSNAAKKFFKEHYENKYNKLNQQKIKYHFDKEEVINNILNRLEFYPLFDLSINGYTNPSDMTIVINSIPGKFTDSQINYFNKTILQIGRIIVIATHEILGHFLRRYYSYLTNGVMSMNTKDDELIDTKKEGGIFTKENFLGLKTHSRLYLKDALYLLFYRDNLNDYPLIKNNATITEEILKIIVEENPLIFDFIKKPEDKKNYENENMIIEENSLIDIEQQNVEENAEDSKEDDEYEEESDEDEKHIIKNKYTTSDKITINQYYNMINPVIITSATSITSCGFRNDEDFIELE